MVDQRTRGARSHHHSGVKKAMPLTTSNTTSALRPMPRQDAMAARPKTVVRPPIAVDGQPLVRTGDRLGTGVGPGDDRDPVAPGDPARHLAVQVRARAAALGVRPVTVGQQQDVPRVAGVLGVGHEQREATCVGGPEGTKFGRPSVP